MNTVILMIETQDEIIKRVRYVNTQGKLKIADLSALNLNAFSVDDKRLVDIIEALEYLHE